MNAHDCDELMAMKGDWKVTAGSGSSAPAALKESPSQHSRTPSSTRSGSSAAGGTKVGKHVESLSLLTAVVPEGLAVLGDNE